MKLRLVLNQLLVFCRSVSERDQVHQLHERFQFSQHLLLMGRRSANANAELVLLEDSLEEFTTPHCGCDQYISSKYINQFKSQWHGVLVWERDQFIIVAHQLLVVHHMLHHQW